MTNKSKQSIEALKAQLFWLELNLSNFVGTLKKCQVILSQIDLPFCEEYEEWLDEYMNEFNRNTDF